MPYRPDLETTLARFAEAWNTDDPDHRWSLVHACAAGEVTYLGPASDRPVEGQAALAAFLGLPDDEPSDEPPHVEIGPFDLLHDWVRAAWRRTAGGDAMTGLLVARVDREHRLVEILHFVD